MKPTDSLLRGHALPDRGRVYDAAGEPLFEGKIQCQCGEWSPVLDSNRQRQIWHREHKREVTG